MAQSNVTKLRGTGHDARTQDNTALLLNSVVADVNVTPIGGAAAPSWVPLTLGAGFAANNATAASHKDALLYVHLKFGVSSAAGVAANATLVTLPQGQRPKEQISFAVRGTAAAFQSVTISPTTGVVSVDLVVGAAGTVDGYLSFLAEQ